MSPEESIHCWQTVPLEVTQLSADGHLMLICKPVLHCTQCKFRVIKPKIFSDIIVSNMPCLALQAQSSVKLCHRSITSLGWLLFAFRLAVHWSFQPMPPSKGKTTGTADTLLTLWSLSQCLSLFASTRPLAVAGDTGTSVSQLFRCYCDVLLWYFRLSAHPVLKHQNTQ